MTEQQNYGQPDEATRQLGHQDMYGLYGGVLVSEWVAGILRDRAARKAEERRQNGLPPRRTLFRRRDK